MTAVLMRRTISGLAADDEVWRDVPGFQGVYMVSSMGRVKSLARSRAGRAGKPCQLPDKILSGSPHPRDGHVIVVLSTGGTRVYRAVHRLVLEAFVGQCPALMEACHNNGDPADNRLCNLRWDTRAGNMADRQRHGGVLRGSAVRGSKLTPSDVAAIRSCGGAQSAAAIRFGVSQSLVSMIRSRAVWRHLA